MKKLLDFLNTKVGLILLIFILVMIHYYITSPYENCRRSDYFDGDLGSQRESQCLKLINKKWGKF